jgi:hypothetical protein
VKKGIGLALNATVFLSTQVTKHKQQGIIGSAPESQKLGWKKEWRSGGQLKEMRN